MYDILLSKKRTLVIQIFNQTKHPITYMREYLYSGQICNPVQFQPAYQILPGNIELFILKNSFMAGLSGEMYLSAANKFICIGFSNPVMGCHKGCVLTQATEFNYSEYKGWYGLDTQMNLSQNVEGNFESQYHTETQIPIYTIIFKN